MRDAIEFPDKDFEKVKSLGNTALQTLRRWFGDWGAEEKNFNPNPTSLVLNEDGTPKVMYRGGSEDIRIFERKKSRASDLYGKGYYFVESEAHAKQYGDARAYYLNIKTSLKPDDNKITQIQPRAFLEAVSENEDKK